MEEGRAAEKAVRAGRLQEAPCAGCGGEAVGPYCPACDGAVDVLIANGERFSSPPLGTDLSMKDYWARRISNVKLRGF